MEDVRAVFVHVDTVLLLAVDVAAQLRTLVDD